MGTGVLPIGQRRIIVTAIGIVGLVAGSWSSVAGAATPESPAPTSTPACEMVIPWPGARGGPAGVRDWSPGGRDWMHKVPDGVVGNVSLTFGTFDEEAHALRADVNDMAGIDLGGPFTDVPERVADVRVQVWLMDLDGHTVVIMVKSLPDTPPELVAEAEAVVASIRVDPDCGGQGPRLLFDLPEGWDTG